MTGPRNQPCIMTGIAIGIQPHDRTDASSHITTQTACVLARFPRLRLSPHPPPTPTQQPPPSAHGPRESVRLRAASVKLLPELIAVIMKVIGNNDHECSKFRHGCWSAWLILKKISGLPGEATTPGFPRQLGRLRSRQNPRQPEGHAASQTLFYGPAASYRWFVQTADA